MRLVLVGADKAREEGLLAIAVSRSLSLLADVLRILHTA